ncbi:MAG: hypothetical protein EA366_00330 [Spirulina sp. DLM2.Bin59]|nr:MAG: hypothetical protein EA366_00330 [Spirulina sp. DLM2.Bin59]
MKAPQRIFLDTNIYILGIQIPESDEAKILEAIGYNGEPLKLITTKIIISPELVDQIRRVSKYLWQKDQSGWNLSQIFNNLNIDYVVPNKDWQKESEELKVTKTIPLEDIEIYLSAKYGHADCFISSNRTLIQSIADFECLTAQQFLQKYMQQ